MTQRLLSMKQVLERIPLSKTEIYRRIRAGTFPSPIKLGVSRIAFSAEEIDASILSRTKLPPREGIAMSIVAPDTAAAITFLLKYAPEGHWHLTAISPDRKSIRSATFSATEAEECRAWVDERNGRENIYFSLNQIKRPLTEGCQTRHCIGDLSACGRRPSTRGESDG